jgi:DNA repair protein RadC
MTESRPHYLGHRQRLKQRFQDDPAQLADYEILEMILGYALPRRDTKPVAKALLDRFGSLKSLFAAKPHEIRAVQGVGPGIELFWGLWREFWARLSQGELKERKVLDSPGAVAAMARARLGFSQTESFWVALVDNKNRLLSFSRVAQGTVDQVAVHSREILSLALECKASGLILVHNHPGGDPTPSHQDRELTDRVKKAGAELGIRVLDHVIVAEESSFSFASGKTEWAGLG